MTITSYDKNKNVNKYNKNVNKINNEAFSRKINFLDTRACGF